MFMTAINHALTGSIIGLAVGDPFIALPLAFLSHFVCDALPHFGKDKNDDNWIKSRSFKRMLLVDASLCVLLVLLLFMLKPYNWFIAVLCAFVATSPDLVWFGKFMALNRGSKWKSNAFARFSSAIQWFQRPIGAVVEIAWLAATIFILRIIIVG